MRDITEETRAANERVIKRHEEQGTPVQLHIVAPGVFAGFPKLAQQPAGFIATGHTSARYYSDEFLQVAAASQTGPDGDVYASEHPVTGEYTFYRKA